MLTSLKHPQHKIKRQKGQAILIIAMAMIGLLVAVGLAIDAGVLFIRRAQLDKAVDAAALSGVMVLAETDNLAEANTRGLQLLGANGIVLAGSTADCSSVNWGTPGTDDDYCGQEQPGFIPGAIRYHVEAEAVSETYFMTILGFDDIPIQSQATAEYFQLVDMYASDLSNQGTLRTSNQSIFGPEQQPSYGDAFSPAATCNTQWNELQGRYTFRITIPASYSHNSVRVEIFDPDTGNQRDNSQLDVYGVDGTRDANVTPTGSQLDAQALDTPWSSGGDNPNPLWFHRVDETRAANCTGNQICNDSSADGNCNTTTLYRLYYLAEGTDGTLSEVDLAYYSGKPWIGAGAAEAISTDLTWISPTNDAAERMPAFDGTTRCVFDEFNTRYGASLPTANDYCVGAESALALPDACGSCPTSNGDFIVDLTTEVPNIFVAPSNGQRDLFIQVIGQAGASENGFEFWAGPPRSAGAAWEMPADVNARQLFIYAGLQLATPQRLHDSEGIGVFGMGYLPMNTNVTATNGVDIGLAYIGPEYAGQTLTIDLWDPDAGAQDPIMFYFDTIPETDWAACFDDGGGTNCESLWGQGANRVGNANIPASTVWTDPLTFTVPDDTTGVPFYGGRLIARYRSGSNDTFVWRMVLDSRPLLVQ